LRRLHDTDDPVSGYIVTPRLRRLSFGREVDKRIPKISVDIPTSDSSYRALFAGRSPNSMVRALISPGGEGGDSQVQHMCRTARSDLYSEGDENHTPISSCLRHRALRDHR
jgi:hypothetical protein